MCFFGTQHNNFSDMMGLWVCEVIHEVPWRESISWEMNTMLRSL